MGTTEQKEYWKEYYRANKEKAAILQKERRANETEEEKEKRKAYHREYQAKNKERLTLKEKKRRGIDGPQREAYLEYQRTYSNNVRDKSYMFTPEWKEKHNRLEKERMVKLREENHEAVKQEQRKRQLRWSLKKYGISEEDFYRMLEEQNNSCKICKTHFKEEAAFSKKRSLYIDHEHVTNKVRGLLCNKCNTGIGFFYENKDYFINAINYLSNPLEGESWERNYIFQ